MSPRSIKDAGKILALDANGVNCENCLVASSFLCKFLEGLSLPGAV
jgi:hypothetical protein